MGVTNSCSSVPVSRSSETHGCDDGGDHDQNGRRRAGHHEDAALEPGVVEQARHQDQMRDADGGHGRGRARRGIGFDGVAGLHAPRRIGTVHQRLDLHVLPGVQAAPEAVRQDHRQLSTASHDLRLRFGDGFHLADPESPLGGELVAEGAALGRLVLVHQDRVGVLEGEIGGEAEHDDLNQRRHQQHEHHAAIPRGL